MSTHQYDQFIPQLNGRVSGETVEIAFDVIRSISPPPPPLCYDFIQHLLCYIAAPPCDPVSDLLLPICNDSCRAYNLLVSNNECLEFNNNLLRFIQSATLFNFDVQVVYEFYENFDCANTSTYYFMDNNGAEFAQEVCTSVFTPILKGKSIVKS